MVTTAQVFTIIGLLCTPMISIAALVLTLAALNLSLGIRSLYVRILGVIFDYATKIKHDKEVPIDSHVSSDEPPTPIKTTSVTPPIIKKAPDDPIVITPETPLIGDSKRQINNEDESEPSQEITTDHDQKLSRAPSQTDIQFKLGKIFMKPKKTHSTF